MGVGTRRARRGLRGSSTDVVTGVLVLLVLVAGAGLTVVLSSLRRDQLLDEYEAR